VKPPWGLRDLDRMPPGFGFGVPQIVQWDLLAYTPFVWFLHAELGHCQSPGRPFVCAGTAMPNADISCAPIAAAMPMPGLGVPQIGHVDLLPKTTLCVAFLHAGLGQCQSPG